ncbi:MAG: hypothetical protein IJR82_04915 [Bacilli bacterium]|nr:hypothetical protein [Bacilli bacterium]
MKQIILFIVIFLVIYLFYLLFVIIREKSLNKWKTGKEMTYLKQVYKLNDDKINFKYLAHFIALSNALILATVVTIISLFKNFVIQMLVGFLILFPTILITYHIIGKFYQKKQLRRKK